MYERHQAAVGPDDTPQSARSPPSSARRDQGGAGGSDCFLTGAVLRKSFVSRQIRRRVCSQRPILLNPANLCCLPSPFEICGHRPPGRMGVICVEFVTRIDISALNEVSVLGFLGFRIGAVE